MAGLLEAYARAAGVAAHDVVERVLCALDKIRGHAGVIETGTTGTARTLAYQYGTPPQSGTPGFAPRSMTDGPYVREAQDGDDQDQHIRLDVYQEESRYAFGGYLANIGDSKFRAAWLLANGSTSGMFTVPPSATVQVPCIVRGVLVERVDGEFAGYQVSLS